MNIEQRMRDPRKDDRSITTAPMVPRLAFVLLAAGAAAALAAEPPVAVLPAKVVAYASASAFAVLDPQEKLRRVKLVGIDAPERRQRYAPEARRFAAEWLSTKPVEIAVHGTDDAGRVLGRIVVDGRDVALALIEAGLAWCDPADDRHLDVALRTAYTAACSRARTQRLGLWQDANPSPPWEYRRLPEFDQPPPPPAADKVCREVGHNTVQCDDDSRYRTVGSEIRGSDGTLYRQRGNTVSGDDGTRYTRQGTSTYGTDGTVCRQRGRQTTCH